MTDARRQEHDEDLVPLMRDADKVGIDAPFGWPAEFVDALVSHREPGGWPGPDRDRLQLRETDSFVCRAWKRPLSVSASWFGATAMYCAHLLHELDKQGEVVDRAGMSGKVVEVYPAAALACWKIEPPGSYKKGGDDRQSRKNRGTLVKSLERLPWLNFPESWGEECVDSDDVVDALLCALIARAATLELTKRPPENAEKASREEGWIHLPREGLDTLEPR